MKIPWFTYFFQFSDNDLIYKDTPSDNSLIGKEIFVKDDYWKDVELTNMYELMVEMAGEEKALEKLKTHDIKNSNLDSELILTKALNKTREQILTNFNNKITQNNQYN